MHLNQTTFLIFILVAVFVLVSGCKNESESLEEIQDRMVAQQQIENPFFSSPIDDIEVDDEELIRFVELGITLGRIQAEARQEMMDLLNDHELNIDVFNSIHHAKSMGFSLDDYNFSDDDLEKYEVVAKKMTEIEQNVDNKFEATISQAGFSDERFLDLNIAMQHDMDLMERARELIMGEIEEIEE